jgi:hypothetical protein
MPAGGSLSMIATFVQMEFWSKGRVASLPRCRYMLGVRGSTGQRCARMPIKDCGTEGRLIGLPVAALAVVGSR